ncbi:MAG: flagellar biosynthesis anti-sigma factor FlgM [Sphingomonadaceae bacterium]|jgi:negative regulator of flagellin synthesis FlgM
MPPIEVGPTRALSRIEARLSRETHGQGKGPVEAQARHAEKTPIVQSEALDAGQPPVDSDRVNEIRKAIESGTYPVLPAKISDAVIAAGFLLRSGK